MCFLCDEHRDTPQPFTITRTWGCSDMKRRKNFQSGIRPVTVTLLVERAEKAERGGYPKPKWVTFCELLLPLFRLTLDEAFTSHRNGAGFSKYIRAYRGGKEFKVRFSNHKPNAGKERAGDCDFFVGARHDGSWQTIEDAVRAVEEFFGVKVRRASVGPVAEVPEQSVGAPSQDVAEMEAHLLEK